VRGAFHTLLKMMKKEPYIRSFPSSIFYFNSSNVNRFWMLALNPLCKWAEKRRFRCDERNWPSFGCLIYHLSEKSLKHKLMYCLLDELYK
jgi:hypothetical protein